MTIHDDDKAEFERLIGELASIMIQPDGLRLCEFAMKIYDLGYERGQDVADNAYSD